MAAATDAPLAPPRPNPTAALSLLGLCIASTVPAIVLHLAGFDEHAHPVLGLVVFGLAIVASAFVLTWAAEVAELEIGSGLAIVFLALVTVLPEYAVDLTFSWKAATDERMRHAALANMCGANRLLIGTGWPVVALLTWYRYSRKVTLLPTARSGEVVWLLLATLYSLQVPLKGYLAWWDAVVFVLCYALYVRGSHARSAEAGPHDEEEEHDLVGPPVVMAEWPKRRRRAAYVGLFVWAAAAIAFAAEPFSESLVEAGTALGIDYVFLVQWLAPLASEAPEFVVVVLLTARGRADLGLGAFISSKINQWTLLVGGVPVAYGLAHAHAGAGFAPSMPMDARQVEELVLTATQGLYAVMTISDLRFSLREAILILVLFLVQFAGSMLLETLGPGDLAARNHLVATFHYAISGMYVALTLGYLVRRGNDLAQRFRETFGKRPALVPAAPPDRGGRGSPDESDA
jgi:cation:H+ antiporter